MTLTLKQLTELIKNSRAGVDPVIKVRIDNKGEMLNLTNVIGINDNEIILHGITENGD